ncbi:MAG: amino acid permease [Acidobacteria bacterium]|nr:amino acid permease [Acidobacteriota bacterium]
MDTTLATAAGAGLPPATRPSHLNRSLGLPHATALVVGTIIGASIFVQPAEITARVPTIGGILLAWTVAGALTLIGALACAELSSAFPKTGGVYVFLCESFSPAFGFLWGWAMFWVMHSGIIAAIAVVFARYVSFFVPLGDAGIRLVAVGAILALSAVNYRGVKQGGVVQNVFTIGKVLAILLMVVIGFALGSRLPEHFQLTAPGSSLTPPMQSVTPTTFLLAVVAGLFAFGGWHMVTYAAEETVEPERTIPLSLLYGIVIVTACYVALNTVYLYILPLETVARSTRIAADAATVVVGTTGGAAMSALVMFSSFGAANGIILAGPRVYYAMARDGLLFRWMADVHPVFRTPHRAIAAQAVWAAVLAWTGTYRQLFTRVVFTEWIFFALMAAGLFILRRRSDYHPAYRIWGYPLVPATFVLFSAGIVLNRIVTEPVESFTGILMVVLGLPVYYTWARPGRATS